MNSSDNEAKATSVAFHCEDSELKLPLVGPHAVKDVDGSQEADPDDHPPTFTDASTEKTVTGPVLSSTKDPSQQLVSEDQAVPSPREKLDPLPPNDFFPLTLFVVIVCGVLVFSSLLCGIPALIISYNYRKAVRQRTYQTTNFSRSRLLVLVGVTLVYTTIICYVSVGVAIMGYQIYLIICCSS